MHSAAILALFALFSLTTASGYFLVDITSSADADIRVSANLNVDYIRLVSGQSHTSVIRPATGARRLPVEFSMYDSPAQKVTFELKSPAKKSLVFGEVVVLVEAKFHCDQGFSGKFCDHQNLQKVHSARTTTKRAFRSAQTTTITSTTTPTTSTISTTTTITTTTPESLQMIDIHYFYTFIISFLITFVLLLIAISTVFFIYSTCQRNQKNKKTSDAKVFKLDLESEVVVEKDPEVRYTAAPYALMFVSSV